ncbi:MAG TPA: DUF418 domain-containing protein [Candidatus Polarisedimenticolia bacterium]|nr:DUF418 domain-containing protein [Candidatus Polarisedimenticolia bacterium]
MPGPGPTSAKERLHALDAIRGVAILGVLVAYTVWSLGNPPRSEWTALDRAVERGMDLFVDNKFLSLFAFLFGLGIAQQWRRWEAAGVDPRPLHLRRMGFLLFVGLLHAALLRNGDILVPYALMGLLMLAFRRVPSRWVAIAAAVLVLMPSIVGWAAPRLGVAWPSRPDLAEAGYVRENIAWVAYWYRTNPFLYWPRILALMLGGLLAGRARVIERLIADRRLTLRLFAMMFPLAVVTRLALDRMPAASPAGDGSLLRAMVVEVVYQSASWSLAACYVTLIVLAVGVDPAAPRLAGVRSIGRMAFTNYLSQSVIVVPLCLAFGLFDRVSPAAGLALAAGIGALQAAFSVGWLRDRTMGPLERVWRHATYGAGVR